MTIRHQTGETLQLSNNKSNCAQHTEPGLFKGTLLLLSGLIACVSLCMFRLDMDSRSWPMLKLHTQMCLFSILIYMLYNPLCEYNNKARRFHLLFSLSSFLSPRLEESILSHLLVYTTNPSLTRWDIWMGRVSISRNRIKNAKNLSVCYNVR